MTCMVSSEIANNMGECNGTGIELKNTRVKTYIGGIFEKFPKSNYPFDIAVSMVSIGNFTWTDRATGSATAIYDGGS